MAVDDAAAGDPLTQQRPAAGDEAVGELCHQAGLGWVDEVTADVLKLGEVVLPASGQGSRSAFRADLGRVRGCRMLSGQRPGDVANGSTDRGFGW